jgi:hypothetical protein
MEPDSYLKNFIQQFRQITLEQVQQHATIYLGQELRVAQDSMQLYQ